MLLSTPPIAWVVLALNSWNYCPGEQGLTPNISRRLYSLLYTAEQHKQYQLKNNVMPPWVNSLATRWHIGNSTYSYPLKPSEVNTESKMLGCQALLSSAVVPTV